MSELKSVIMCPKVCSAGVAAKRGEFERLRSW